MSAQPVDDRAVRAFVEDAASAPSMHNAQPWRFRYVHGTRTFHLRADFGRAMPHADPDTRALHVGCGAALLNLRVAVAHHGWSPAVRLLPDPVDPAALAALRLEEPGHGTQDPDGLADLHPAIRHRHTSRYPFEERDLPDPVRAELREAARREGAWLEFPTPWHRQWVLELVQEAEFRNLTDRGSDEDLARWTRLGGDAAAPVPDGVPDYAFGPRKRGGRAPVRDFAGGRRVTDRAAAEFEHSPHLALLSTADDLPLDWLRAGQALERVLLLATLRGLASSFATQALEWPDIRWPLRDPVSGLGHVQTVLRLGYGPPGPATPRRPLEDVLDIEP